MTPEAEFAAIVGGTAVLDQSMHPTHVTQRLWYGIADTYDVRQLASLLEYNARSVLEVERTGRRVPQVTHACLVLLAFLYRYEGREPEQDTRAFSAVLHMTRQHHPHPIQWSCLQEAIDYLVESWSEVQL